ncbi:MAG TPA: LPS export ABC transporter periplasmic protein LptC, partial [Vicinamibacterales bacterium]|nr:LPS export ABC transporter periplasmic protein LptC [Vicinamibacterales bacterium]
MTRWQRGSRWVILVCGIVFAIFVARQLKPRDPLPPMTPVARTDPGSIVETRKGQTTQIKGAHEDVSITYDTQDVYEDGSSRLHGAIIEFDEKHGDRTFKITGKEGRLGKNATTMTLDGAVKLEGSDGMIVLTEHVSYADADGVVRAPGPVEMTKGRIHATGTGMTWDKTSDVLIILDQAVVHIAPEHAADGPSEVTSGTATFARRDKYLRFERAVRMLRSGQNIEAENAVMYLSPDEKRIETVELHDHSKITSTKVVPGGLQSMSGYQMNLKYAADGESLEHALVTGDASIQIAGEPGKQGRQIVATTIDIALGPDGSTPTALLGREAVQLTFPPEPGTPGRTIRALNLDAKGEPG